MGRRIVAMVAALAVAVGLAACGSGGGGSGGTVTVEGEPSGNLTISNWPLYIDPGKEGTVAEFEKATGISVKYIEDVNDNAEFFGKMQPLLEKGESGGRSLFVVTDWMAKKMHDLGYLQSLDKSGIPNVEENLVQSLRHPGFDPNRDFSVPWQSGMGGIIVRTDLAPEVRSVCDLFDPKYKGKVDFLSELRETVPLVMTCMGIDPEEATEADWMKAIEKIKGAVESGQIRRFTGNDYARDLTSGDAVAVIGWSGDAVQLQADNPNIEWRMPTQGCSLWSDNMVIPVGQAKIAEYVNYVTPVEGVKSIFEKTEPELAESELIFPSASFTKKCFTQAQLSEEEEGPVTRAWNAVLNG
jgi:spermidine/putrescine transport system substrate-binding protein